MATAMARPVVVRGGYLDQPRYAEFIRLRSIVDRYTPEEP